MKKRGFELAMDVFILPSGRQQATYDYLLGIARSYPDEIEIQRGVQPKIPDKISPLDLVVASSKGVRVGIDLQVPGRPQTVFAPREDIIQKIYRLLRGRDSDQDGTVDVRWKTESLRIDLSSDEPEKEDFVRDIYGRFRMGVLKVEVKAAGQEVPGSGTAFIVSRVRNPDGSFRYRALTNAHVVDEDFRSQMGGDVVQELWVRLMTADDNYVIDKVEIVGSDPLLDLALLEFRTSADLPVCILGSTSEVRTHDHIIVIGNTRGRGIAAVAGHVNEPRKGRELYPFSTIQHDAAVTGGNSGSPAFSRQGKVIGMHFSSVSESEIRMAIPAERIISSWRKMESSTKARGVSYGEWGVSLGPMTVPMRERVVPADLASSGVQVWKVYSNSPASHAGLVAGDIILGVNGDRSVTNIRATHEMFKIDEIIRDSKTGEKFTLEVYRPGVGRRKLTLIAVEISFGSLEAYHTDFGFTVYDISPHSRRTHGIPGSVRGVWVTLDARNPDDLNSLNSGTIITEVNGRQVSTVEEFRKAIRVAVQKEGDDIFLNVFRPGRSYVFLFGGLGGQHRVLIER